jgi:hypothetical protein
MAGADTASGSSSTCPGCGLTLPGSADLHGRANASETCWQLYGEVASNEALHLGVLGRLHQLTVDAYAAQHAGGSAARIGVAFALIGLSLSLDEGWSGDQVRDAHQYLGATFKDWPGFAPAAERTWMTVYDVALASSPEEHARLVQRWASEVWAAWAPIHSDVLALIEARLPADVRGRITSAGSRTLESTTRSTRATTMGYPTDDGVDAYIEALPDWQQAICQEVRDLIHDADPEVVETTKRKGQPYFVLHGNICALLAVKDHVNVFLYDGGIVPDPDGIITGGHDNETARTVAIREGEQINAPALNAMFRQIIANNRAGGWRKLKATRADRP